MVSPEAHKIRMKLHKRIKELRTNAAANQKFCIKGNQIYFIDPANPSTNSSEIMDSTSGKSPYIILRNDRIGRKGGGVAILINSKLHYIPVNQNNPNILAVDIIQNKSSSTRYILIYRPLKLTKPQSTKLFDNVREVINIPSIFPIKNVVLLGDFNYPDVKWNAELFSQSGAASPLIDLVLEKQFHQYVFQPTRNNNILDLVFSTDSDSVSDIKITDPISDHNVVHFQTSNQYEDFSKPITYSDFKNGDFDALNNYFNSIKWEAELKKISISNDVFDYIRDKIKYGISQFSPTRIYDPRKNIPENMQRSLNFYLQYSSDPLKISVVNRSIKKLNKEFLLFEISKHAN